MVGIPRCFNLKLKQTNTTMNLVMVASVVLVCVVGTVVEGRVCTKMRGEKTLKAVKYRGECYRSFQARCHWFSMEMCTFNETYNCVKEHNMTVQTYRIVEACCPGYHTNRDGKCVATSEPGSDDRHDRLEDDDDDDDNVFLNISHGVYAGIISGILFVLCVALLTALHYRKKRLAQEKKAMLTGEQDATQKQLMIPMDKLDSPAPVPT